MNDRIDTLLMLGALIDERAVTQLALMAGDDGMVRWHLVRHLDGILLPSSAPQPLTVTQACAAADDPDAVRARTRRLCGELRLRAKQRSVSAADRRRLQDNVTLLRGELAEAAA